MNHATERSHGNERNVSLLSFIFGTFSILLILVHVSHPRQKKFASTKLLGITWFRTVFSIQLSFSGRLKGEGAVAGFQSKKISFCEWRGERNRRLCFSFTALAVYAFNFYCNWRLIIIRPLLLPADVDVFAPPPRGGVKWQYKRNFFFYFQGQYYRSFSWIRKWCSCFSTHWRNGPKYWYLRWTFLQMFSVIFSWKGACI